MFEYHNAVIRARLALAFFQHDGLTAQRIADAHRLGEFHPVHAQIGYLVDPFTPYLGVRGLFKMQDDYNGKPDPKIPSGYVLIPEPGLIVDVADLLSLQFGVPFTIVGKNKPQKGYLLEELGGDEIADSAW